MKTGSSDLVSRALRDPESLLGWSLVEWDALVRQARRANLLARIATDLDERALLPRVPRGPRGHLRAALVLARAHRRAIEREVRHVGRALASLDIEPVLLKGAAYVVADLPAARGRLFSDVDILVPADALPAVERLLKDHGWRSAAEDDEYYQHYYREWGHELPPMQHAKRKTVLDVHHAIVPRTARFKPDSQKLLQCARAVDAYGMRVLSPADMVLHSATHLVQNEELSQGLRDLADLDALLRHFSSEAFWSELPVRAAELDLTTPLRYGLRYAQRIFGTPVPDPVTKACETRSREPVLSGLMDALWMRALCPDHPTAAGWQSPIARALLALRAHLMRMPPRLLLYHAAVKMLRGVKLARSQDA